MMIRARASLVRARTGLVNAARGLAKSYGERLRSCNVRNMNPEKAEALSPELQRALEPLLSAIEELSERIVEYDDRIEALAKASYPQVELLKQIKGVGTLIALTFLLTLEDPHRFGKSRDVAAIWDCSRDEETPERGNRRCISAKKAIPICGRCWCRERSTFWDHSASIVISDDGSSGASDGCAR
jgi:hypothetical protein